MNGPMATNWAHPFLQRLALAGHCLDMCGAHAGANGTLWSSSAILPRLSRFYPLLAAPQFLSYSGSLSESHLSTRMTSAQRTVQLQPIVCVGIESPLLQKCSSLVFRYTILHNTPGGKPVGHPRSGAMAGLPFCDIILAFFKLKNDPKMVIFCTIFPRVHLHNSATFIWRLQDQFFLPKYAFFGCDLIIFHLA